MEPFLSSLKNENSKPTSIFVKNVNAEVFEASRLGATGVQGTAPFDLACTLAIKTALLQKKN